MNTLQQRAKEQSNTQTPEEIIKRQIKKMSGQIELALPKTITADRFTRITLSALSSNKDLAKTEPMSFLAAMMTAAQLGLEPNTPLGQAYLIPRTGKNGILQCEFQLGYRGMIDLAYRSGEVVSIFANVVCKNDDFEYSFGLEPTLKHVPATENRGEQTFVYAIFRTKAGGYGYDVMSINQVTEIMKRCSKSYSSKYSPWQTSFEEMAKKTVLKRVLKYAPLSAELMRDFSQDEVVREEISDNMYDIPGVYVEPMGYDVDAENQTK